MEKAKKWAFHDINRFRAILQIELALSGNREKVQTISDCQYELVNKFFPLVQLLELTRFLSTPADFHYQKATWLEWDPIVHTDSPEKKSIKTLESFRVICFQQRFFIRMLRRNIARSRREMIRLNRNFPLMLDEFCHCICFFGIDILNESIQCTPQLPTRKPHNTKISK